MGPRLRDLKDSVEVPAKPPALVARWQPVLAMIVAALGLVSIAVAAGSTVWETKAHAQEVATANKAECKANLESTVAATRADLMVVQLKLAKLEVSSQWQEAVLRQIAKKLDVAPTLPPAVPSPAPVTQDPAVTP